jgi:hypothetical protein
VTGDPHVLQPDHAPTPFTASEIRAGCPAGRTISIVVELSGQEPHRRTNRFVRCDQDGALVERTRTAMDGTPIDAPESGWATWLEMQGHASTPADRTTIEPTRLETPMGVLDCLRYTVADGTGVETLWFATALPGMPVRTETRIGGELVAVVRVVGNEMPSGAAPA